MRELNMPRYFLSCVSVVGLRKFLTFLNCGNAIYSNGVAYECKTGNSKKIPGLITTLAFCRWS